MMSTRSTAGKNDHRQEKRRKLSPETMSEEEDRKSGGGQSETIRNKLLGLFSKGMDTSFVEKSKTTLMKRDSDQLQALRSAQPHTIPLTAVVDVVDDLGTGIHTIQRYDIPVHRNSFLALACQPKRLFVREGYDELYEYISEHWISEDYYRVVLLGNSGSGKSWFQIFALKQLLSCDPEKRKYDIVIRQVASRLFLMDLDEAKVYLWEVSLDPFISCSQEMERTLYFFEPGNDSMTSPLPVLLPSLSTLSPCISRIQEYRKTCCKVVYFWPWSSGELRAVLQDSVPPISNADFLKRYHSFGGIVRHILHEDLEIESNLKDRLKNMDFNLLTSATTLNMDRDAVGENISGFLICYDNRSIKGRDRFAIKKLEFTSACVKEEVQERIRRLPVQESMQIVLDRLDGEKKRDISGKVSWASR
jgi:hypothetical protein